MKKIVLALTLTLALPVAGQQADDADCDDPQTQVERMIRVDHAGEYGAARIYQGQLAVLGHRPVGDTIRAMADQEQRHLDTFDRLLVERRVRPTALSPVWHVAGYALGVATAAMGERAAMAGRANEGNSRRVSASTLARRWLNA